MFRLADTSGGDVDVLCNGRPEYRVETKARGLEDFVPACWWPADAAGLSLHQVADLPTAGGRVTLSGTRLIHTVNGRRSEEILVDDQAVLAAYREHFRIVLDRLPELLASE